MKTKSKISFASIMSDTMAVISKVNVIVLTLLMTMKVLHEMTLCRPGQISSKCS